MMPLIAPLVETLGISDLLDQYPLEISGGQKQRVAIARALITNPDIVLADEPTGALDSKSAGELLSLFEEVNEQGQTVLMVTHSTLAASHAKRVIFIRDGKLFHQLYRGNISHEDFFVQIADILTVLSSGVEHHE